MKVSSTKRTGTLRAKAEQRLKRREAQTPPPHHLSESDAATKMKSVLHELEVHQVELEVQNEELREARREGEALLERYMDIFDFAPIGYATLGPDFTIHAINHCGVRLLGRGRAQLVGNRFTGFVPALQEPALLQLLERAQRREALQMVELDLAIGQTATLPVRATASMPTNGDTILLAFWDVTELRASVKDLDRSRCELREADRRKNAFRAALSHELRNPLAPIRSSVFVLSRAEPGSEKARRAGEIIERQVTHLARLIEDLLDVTRITHGKVQIRREPTDVAELVRRTLGVTTRASRRAGSRSRRASGKSRSGWTPTRRASSRS